MLYTEPVLIVDDDAVFTEVALSILAVLGVENVHTAGDGEEGIEVLRNMHGQVGLILLDLNMPKLDGLAFMRALSLAGFSGHIALSSGESGKIVQSAQNMGKMLGINILGTLKKPLEIGEVAAMLGRSSRTSAEARSARKSGDATEVTEDMLVPYYQPQFSTKDRSLCGVEALSRIDLGNGRHMAPGGFFEEINQSGRASAVALSVIKKVFTDAARWKSKGLVTDLSVNLDAAVLEDGNIVPELIAQTENFGISPERVVLELTETALPKDMSRLLETLTRLGMAGFGLSLDDYGTGGSNFEVLRLCPFTEVKIDLSIVQAMVSDPLSAQFVETTVKFAQSLGLRMVAEGVESEEQFNAIRDQGIDVVQGFLLGRPVPALTFEKILNDSQQLRATA